MPSATVGRERVKSHASAVLRHPHGFSVNVGIFQRALQIAGVRIYTKVPVASGLQCAVPIVDDIVVHVRIGGWLMPLPRPLFQVVVHGVRQVARVHTKLLKFGDHVGTFFFGNRRSVLVGIPVDAERDAKSLAFGNVTLCFLVSIVAPTIAEADDHAFHAVCFRFGPVDVALPFGNVNHAFGLLHEQVVLVVEEGFRIVVSAPVRAVFIAFEFGELYVRVGYSIFDIFRTYRNEGFAIGFGERIRLLILRTDQRRIGHGFAGFNILDLTFGGNG